MRTVLFQNFEIKMSEVAIVFQGTKNFRKFLEDISKGVRFYKAAALQPIYLLKRTLLLKKMLKF